MTTYTASYLYRQTFMKKVLWLMTVIALCSGAYHLYLEDYWITFFKMILLIGSVTLLYTLSKIALHKTTILSMLLTYGVIFSCMTIDSVISVWMLTLPAFGFATLKKKHALYANTIGLIMLVCSFLLDMGLSTQHYSNTYFINILGGYLVLAYACLIFHQLIIHYRDELAESMAETRKLQASRTLSSGIAHLINNQMTGIIGYTSCLEANGHHDAKFLSEISKSAFKTSQHANDLLAYTGQAVMVHDEWINLSQCIEYSLEKIDTPENIQISLTNSEKIPLVFGNTQQINQSILDHVLINAVESNAKSSIQIQLYVEHINQHDTLQAGNYVCVSIHDDGDGMDSDTIRQAFDPFYSTKFLGRGMGLAAAFGAMQQHHGLITLKSNLGESTTCQLWFPIKKHL